MSVINQMLNDLEKRQEPDSAFEAHPYNQKNVPATKSRWPMVVALVVIFVLFACIGYLLMDKQLARQQVAPVQDKNDNNIAVLAKAAPTASGSQPDIKPGDNGEQLKQVNADSGEAKKPTGSAVQMPNKQEPAKQEPAKQEQQAVENHTSAGEAIAQGLSNSESAEPESPALPVQHVTKPAQVQQAEQVPAKPKLSIKRSELTPQEVAELKVTEARKAIDLGELDKAAQLLEQVLVLEPKHIEAREQLTALWFGKKDYQAAINLLKQGLMFLPDYGEYRLLLAKIYLELERVELALSTLEQDSTYADNDYQTLRASLAQQLDKNESAVTAYQYLLTHNNGNSASIGRWWLGLAIAYDRLGRFDNARKSYRQALSAGHLSTSSLNFAKKRLIQLGE